MPCQSRRKTLSPSKASTFLSSINLTGDPLSLPSPPCSPNVKGLPIDIDNLSSPGVDENGQVVDKVRFFVDLHWSRTRRPAHFEQKLKINPYPSSHTTPSSLQTPNPRPTPTPQVNDTLNNLLHTHLSPKSASPKKKKKKKRRNSILAPTDVLEIKEFINTEIAPIPETATTACTVDDLSVDDIRLLLVQFQNSSTLLSSSNKNLSQKILDSTSYPLLSLLQMRSSSPVLSSSNLFQTKRGLLLRLSPHFSEMEVQKKRESLRMERETGCRCERGREGYCYFDGEGEEVEGEEYGRRYMAAINSGKVKELPQLVAVVVEEEVAVVEEEDEPTADDINDVVADIDVVETSETTSEITTSTTSTTASTNNPEIETEETSRAELALQLKNELFTSIDVALQKYVKAMKNINGGVLGDDVLDILKEKV
ncbi:hypothetical protein TL16_g01455 [Triparma laevis f. inornata]|uniref:Uncharacterized protein n=1 Tax=Triparma laevis f. inornata TaxID=1714386 RepID=A0A9W6ZIP1_9STRA|nr:hypothetical protein TL16_g01455 [Triparma laevis f. inornata]